MDFTLCALILALLYCVFDYFRNARPNFPHHLRDLPALKRFEYKPLEFPSRTIRLIELEEGSGWDEIRCNLGVYRIGDDKIDPASALLKYPSAPPFEALSYYWGDATRCHGIRLQGCCKLVTASLDEILRGLRRPDKSRWLWIDQLCINQEEKKPYEKPPQILLMTKIYTRAFSVPIWIGQESDSTRSAVDVIEAACQKMPSADEVRFGVYKDTPSGQQRDLLKEEAQRMSDAQIMSYHLSLLKDYSGLPKVGTKERTALVQFYNKPWFFRCWTFQEVVLSRSAIIYCGKHTASWDKVGWVAALLDHDPSAFSKDKYEYAGAHAAKTTWYYQLGYRSAKTTPPLIELLATGSGHNMATDPSDRIFAFLGIAKETAGKEITEVPMALRPRYTTPSLWELAAVKVYTDLAWYYITTTESLSILSHVHHTPLNAQKPYCPSWVPRWNRERPRCQIWQHQDTDETGFRAHGSLSFVNYSLEEKGGLAILQVFGSELYTVYKISDVLEEKNMLTTSQEGHSPSLDYNWIRKLHQMTGSGNLQQWGDNLSPEARPPRLLQESFILTAGRRGYGHEPMNNGSKNPSSDEEHMNDYAALLAILFKQELVTEQNIQKRYMLENAIHSIASRAAKGNGMNFGKQATAACESRRFFRVRQWGPTLVGLGPMDVQVGDKICILAGGKVPFVLRRMPAFVDTRYTLIGECYMPEIMFGEGLMGQGIVSRKEMVFSII